MEKDFVDRFCDCFDEVTGSSEKEDRELIQRVIDEARLLIEKSFEERRDFLNTRLENLLKRSQTAEVRSRILDYVMGLAGSNAQFLKDIVLQEKDVKELFVVNETANLFNEISNDEIDKVIEDGTEEIIGSWTIIGGSRYSY